MTSFLLVTSLMIPLVLSLLLLDEIVSWSLCLLQFILYNFSHSLFCTLPYLDLGFLSVHSIPSTVVSKVKFVVLATVTENGDILYCRPISFNYLR